VMKAPAPEPAAEADEPPLPPLLRTAIVMVGALLLAVSSGSKLRVEMACETGALLEGTRFCAWSPGRRIQVCAALFAALFLFDIVLVVAYSVVEAVVAVARAACRAPAAFADLAHEALVEWRRRRKAAARRNRQALRDAEADKERRAERKREAEATWRRARERSQKKAQEKPKKKPPRPRSAPPKPKPKPKANVPPESERHQTPPATPPEPKRELESDPGVLEHKGIAEALDAGVPESKSTPSEYEESDSKGVSSLTPSELTRRESVDGVTVASSFDTLDEAEEDELYAALDAELEESTGSESTETNRNARGIPILLACLVGLIVTATVVEVGWLMLEHVGRSAAVRRALETGVVLRVARAVHETQRERGLISTYVASDGRARALELGRQFLRTDAAMDLAVGAVLKHADTSKPRGIDTDLSPKRTAARLGAAVDLAARRSAYVLSDEPRGSPPARLRSLAPEAGGCRRKSCQKLRALLREREDSSHDRAAAPSRRTTSQTHRDVFDVYTSMNEQLLAVARDACVELMRSGLRAQNLAPSLFASVKLASYKEYVAVERGLVSADLAAHATTGNRRKESPVTAETRDRLVRISVLQEAALQSFQAFAPKPLLTSFSRHAAKPCVHDAVVLRTELLDGTSNPPPTHDEWFELQSCRVDSLQGLMDEIQTTIIADAKASQRAALKRLAYLGMPLLLLCFCAATVGLRALTGLVTYQERVSEKLRKLKSSERKYKRLLLAWAPLSAWVRAVETDNEDDDDDASAAAR